MCYFGIWVKLPQLRRYNAREASFVLFSNRLAIVLVLDFFRIRRTHPPKTLHSSVLLINALLLQDGCPERPGWFVVKMKQNQFY